HAPYSVSPTLFRELKQLAVRYGCPLSCHVAEFAEEERFLQEGGGELQEFLEDRGVYDPRWKPPGMRPIPYLDSLGVLDNLVAVHLNSINQDLDLLASRKVSAVFCPRSTRWFGRQEWMPVRQMLDRGIPVALGTDSLASNDSLNFLEELKVAEKMLADVSRPELLEMATRGGAQALGLNSGTVVPGAFADLIGFQIAAPPEAWSDVPFEPDRREVDFAMVGGDRVF
ncbi:MAG: amidohydrolase family protein, partial [Nitrospinaceae bacterium]|nr:amidohydrolase family protein [Nitrospinaceae bacterium]NIR54181.1 amidohydrolase family protein [Nitrospinaceae bacterium]NIS84599.1 amidohydrolase family protein [Nitrospinaceae bacterium]NIT81391.1 amidohydrolase family protein [Nitrospinaceae bacterium]NIU43678.1 amidohydrolase family protein [Nitrospinaceae bacterium]